ncbi:hypothetical protein BH09PAT2_BH09PAT2_02750 [soil metagenome]
MTIQQIYEQYILMPTLQMHQYRVAGVAHMLCLHYDNKVDAVNIVAACLLHDMGNILKFKLEMFPDFLEPQGMDYWKKIKNEYHYKYGNDEHKATLEIAKEIFKKRNPAINEKLNTERTLELINAIGFSSAQYNFESIDISRKIAAYADMRMEPHGVTSLALRLKDGNKRFKIHKPGVGDEAFFNEMAEFLKKIEQQLFNGLEISP